MKKLILLFFTVAMNQPLINFSNESSSNWQIINDTVMGGRSKAAVEFTGNSMIFTGIVSLKNNGGFVSYRSPYQRFDFNDFKGVEIRYRSTGRAFSFQLETNQAWRLPNYKHSFENTTNEWVIEKLSFSDFEEYRVGRKTGKKMTLSELDKVIRIGFILIDKKEGPFQLEVDYVKLY